MGNAQARRERRTLIEPADVVCADLILLTTVVQPDPQTLFVLRKRRKVKICQLFMLLFFSRGDTRKADKQVDGIRVRRREREGTVGGMFGVDIH